MSEETVTLLKDLAFSREMIARGKEWIEQAQKEFEALPEYQKLLEVKEEMKTYQKRADECYEALTTWAESKYAEDGDKHPITGVEIKIVTEVTVTDEKAAKQWAADNAPATLSLNMTKFKPIARQLELSFVKTEEKPQAYIGSDLSEYLPK